MRTNVYNDSLVSYLESNPEIKLNSNEKKLNCFEKSDYKSNLLTRKVSMLIFNDRYNGFTEETLLRKRNYEEHLTNCSSREYKKIQECITPGIFTNDNDTKMNESEKLAVTSEEVLPNNITDVVISNERKYLEEEEEALPNDNVVFTSNNNVNIMVTPPTREDDIVFLTSMFGNFSFTTDAAEGIDEFSGSSIF